MEKLLSKIKELEEQLQKERRDINNNLSIDRIKKDEKSIMFHHGYQYALIHVIQELNAIIYSDLEEKGE